MPDSVGLPPNLPADWPHRDASRVVTAAGIRWHVQRRGTGPTIVLVHGSAGATHTWRGVWPLLTPWADVIAFDLPGHGFTTGATRNQLSLDGMADAVAALLTALDAHPSAGVGHSAGAAVLLQLSASRRVPLHSVICVNSALVSINALGQFLLPLSRSIFDVPFMHTAATALLRTGDVARMILRTTGTVLDPEQEARYVAMLTDEARVGAVLQMMSRWDLTALQAQFPTLALPITLVHSRNEPWVNFDELLEATRTLPQRTVIDVTPAGHLIPDEQPQRLAEIIAQQVTAARAAPG